MGLRALIDGLLGKKTRTNTRYTDTQGNPTPDALDEDQAGKARGEFVDETMRKLDEENEPPRYGA